MTTMQAVEQQVATQREACENAQQRHEQALKVVGAAEDRRKALDAEIAELRADLAKVEKSVEKAHVSGRKVERLRTQRRDIRARLEDLLGEHPLLERQVEGAEARARRSLAEMHLERRRQLQVEGKRIGAEIRRLIGETAQRYERWQAVAAEDRASADVVRSAAPELMNAVPTFSWATGVDPQAAIAALLQTGRRKDQQS